MFLELDPHSWKPVSFWCTVIWCPFMLHGINPANFLQVITETQKALFEETSVLWFTPF